MNIIILLSFVIFCSAMILLSLGWLISKKSLRGSCGGPAVMGSDGLPISCDTCPNKEANPNCERAKPKSIDPVG